MATFECQDNGTAYQFYSKEVRDEHFEGSVEEAEKRAHELRQEGLNLLDYAQREKQRAEEAQRAASEMAAEANRIAENALNKQIEGQEKLALAAQKMLEAGVHLQREAASVTVAEVPYNTHEVADIRQATVTSGAVVKDIKQDIHVVREAEVTCDQVRQEDRLEEKFGGMNVGKEEQFSGKKERKEVSEYNAQFGVEATEAKARQQGQKSKAR
ncbi:hypothetical protein AAVH_42775 [Aphelenchoides avenae]|nr:hypothetical protein AAVH_42775 [Aphelenchus avenae]